MHRGYFASKSTRCRREKYALRERAAYVEVSPTRRAWSSLFCSSEALPFSTGNLAPYAVVEQDARRHFMEPTNVCLPWPAFLFTDTLFTHIPNPSGFLCFCVALERSPSGHDVRALRLQQPGMLAIAPCSWSSRAWKSRSWPTKPPAVCSSSRLPCQQVS